MPSKLGPEEFQIQLKFGGGIHSRASEDEVDLRNCVSGQNFDLDSQNRDMRNRKPFDLVGTTPNAAEVRGFVSLLKTDGTVSFLVQSGDTVYEWDGTSSFTSKGTVNAAAKLRGRLSHNWQLDNKVIITDLALLEPVMEWDGTTLQDVTFKDETKSTVWTGDFRAKYCYISNERVVYANIYDNGSTYPHMIIGSQRGDYDIITVANRPASALGEADPFFLIQPDYRKINGVAEAFGQVVISSEKGSLFTLTGDSSKDFAISQLHPFSGVDGDESLTFIGNDILYGRQGRIESVTATDKYGDVESDDISVMISDSIEDYSNWTLAYNSRKQRVYCSPASQAELWVLHKPLLNDQAGMSPWSRWKTEHVTSFNPTAMMTMFDPSDGLEYVFFGDDSGNIYRMEGSGSDGDGGAADIKVERRSKIFQIPADMEMFEVQGFIRYKKLNNASVTIAFEYQGESVFDSSVTIDIDADSSRKVYGGGLFYNNGEYYGSIFTRRLYRQTFSVAGRSNEMQVRVSVTGKTDIAINEVSLRITGVS